MARTYNDPIGGTPSSIGDFQMNDFNWKRKALIEARREAVFSPLASVENQPKQMGKTMKCYHYLPMLSDANINSEGIDAAGIIANGTVGTYKRTIGITNVAETSTGNGYVTRYAIGEATTAAAALTLAEAQANSIFAELGVFDTDYATTVAALGVLGWTISIEDAVPNTGNLYGSSKDVGTIQGKLPAIGESGGRYNRVGFTRIDIEGSIDNFGFFSDYTEDSMQFDSDADLEMHVNREMITGAMDITEAALQIDLLNSAGIVKFGGVATSTAEINGEAGTESLATYEDLVRLSIDLDNNRCPKKTTMITGTRYTDTLTLDACRVLYCASELVPQLKGMKDGVFNDRVLITVQKYAAGGNTMKGEVGAIDNFRIVVAPEMQFWAGAGASVSTNNGYRETGGKYDVYPMLCVGQDSFSTIGFQSDGKSHKFKIKHSKPHSDISYANDPYGKTGFMSVQWWYGFLLKRPERIALFKTVVGY